MGRQDFMNAYIDERFYMDFSRKRKPDCWVNVYENWNRREHMLGAFLPFEAAAVRKSRGMLTSHAAKTLYRIRVYLKPKSPPDPNTEE